MCGVSTSLRFPGQLNGSVSRLTRCLVDADICHRSDLRKLGMNLIPFPRVSPLTFLRIPWLTMHPSYISSCRATPRSRIQKILSTKSCPYQTLPGRKYFHYHHAAPLLPDFRTRLFDRKNLLVACDPRFGFVMSCSTTVHHPLTPISDDILQLLRFSVVTFHPER
jgi:hypothetical protein